MKKLVLFFTFIALVSMSSQAQVKLGLIGGLNVATFSVGGTDAPSTDSRSAYHLGLIIEHGINDAFAIQSGLLLSSKGGSLTGPTSVGGSIVDAKVTFSPLYLELPINALYKIAMGSAKLHLFGGPYFAYGMSGKFEASAPGFTGTSQDIKFGSSADSDLKTIDFGLNLGAGIEINNILIRAQYGIGLTNMIANTSGDETMKNRVIGISVGYMFGSSSSK